MRAGACALQQTLTQEAASVLKHSLSLARRRGHAQITPLHVATTLLTTRNSILKRACAKSQPIQAPHPFHCRALELCFNVALNRLPTTPTPLIHSQPSYSNALIAALKRAQAHQRRGCIENQQQQPLLAIKVEIEQLVLSILDDPSVSRVMKEAGFSSTAVKSNLEDSSPPSSVFYGSSGGVYSSPCSPSRFDSINPSSFLNTHFLAYNFSNSEPNQLFFSPRKKNPDGQFVDLGCVKEVLEVFQKKKRRNTVIVGDSVSATEAVVSELMSNVEKREVPEELKSTHFIKFQFSSVPLRFMKREEVEMNLSDLKRKVDSLASDGGGVIIYTGDLKWTAEMGSEEISCGYNPVNHLVAEIGRLLCDYSSLNARVWLVATANFQTYMRCQMRQPSLEVQWSLQAVSVPSGGLGLSLHASGIQESRISFSQKPTSQVVETKPFAVKEEQEKLTCCAECTSKYEKEANLVKSGQLKPSYHTSSCSPKDRDKDSTQLPHWLQPHDKEAEQKDDLVELRRKWSRICHSQHQGRPIQGQATSFLFSNNQSSTGKIYSHGSSYPWWPNQGSIFPDSNSISFTHSTLKPIHVASSFPRFRRQQSCHIEFSFSSPTGNKPKHQPNLDSLKNSEGEKEVKITLALGNSDFLHDEKVEEKRCDILKKLQDNLPWQLEAISEIVEALVDPNQTKKETWVLIEGNDRIGKQRLARAIAESVFGSSDLLLHMDMREWRDKNKKGLCCGMIERALRDHEKLVVLVEEVDFADTQFMNFLCDGFQSGKFGDASENSCEAIFILTKGGSESYGEVKDFSVTQMILEVSEKEKISNFETPKSENKRKAEPDLPNKAKNPRIEEKESASPRGLSPNTLDLNITAKDGEDENNEKMGDLSPISSDLTRETGGDLHNPHGFFELLKNRFVFDLNLNRNMVMRDMILSKIKLSFEDVCESEGLNCLFEVEERLLEKVLDGLGSFLNSLFEKWLKEVFQTSLRTVKIGGKKVLRSVRLCLGGKGESGVEASGIMGSSFPKKIQVSFIG
ncbi:hypothetical protein NMG60_11023807 [Bertholletia excelsa]